MSVESGSVRWIDRQAVVTMPDEIDIINAEQVGEVLDRVMARRPEVLVTDMTGTTFCASEGLRILIRTHRHAAEAGTRVRIAGPGPMVRRVMELTATDQVLDIYPSVDAALAGDGGLTAGGGT